MRKRLWKRKDHQHNNDDDEEMKDRAAEMGAEETVEEKQGEARGGMGDARGGIKASYQESGERSTGAGYEESTRSTAQQMQRMPGVGEPKQGMMEDDGVQQAERQEHEGKAGEDQTGELLAPPKDAHENRKKKKHKRKSHKKSKHQHQTPPFCESSEFTLNCRAPDLGCTLIGKARHAFSSCCSQSTSACTAPLLRLAGNTVGLTIIPSQRLVCVCYDVSEYSDLPARIQKLLPEGWEGIFVDWIDPTGRLALDTSVRKYDQVRVTA